MEGPGPSPRGASGHKAASAHSTYGEVASTPISRRAAQAASTTSQAPLLPHVSSYRLQWPVGDQPWPGAPGW